MDFTLFNELLAKKMTRQEFLVHIGLLIITIMGITSLLKTLANPHLSSSHSLASRKVGFGGGPYGGRKENI